MTCALVALYAGPRVFSNVGQVAWLLMTSCLGTWAVLASAKIWEGSRGDAMARRLVSMAIGMALGTVACVLGQYLMVSLPPASNLPGPLQYQLPSNFYAEDGRPLLVAYAACFGTLFLLVRWWLQADPSRRRRLRLRGLAISIFVAALVGWIWQFPQPWLPVIAGTMSLAVQLGSPCECRSKPVRSG